MKAIPESIYLATGNSHKLEEFRYLVDSNGLSINLCGAEMAGGMPDVEESGLTFEENALIKARALAMNLKDNEWVLSDDSGLMVDALAGGPGVHSARFSGPGASAFQNNAKLLEELQGVPLKQRTARFICVLCLLSGVSSAHYFVGLCEGHILASASGDEGFGYDPLFRPIGYEQTFAALGPAAKHQLSHRGKAVEALAKFLQSQEFTGT